ncbi:ABC-three component system protein [Bradyrhizobium erythrophlei]|uniref:ABC-three component systems C-terminal domain-containing protein n=1 Tax=Bradyrhizobium erythrophlei TaxID=1437360 RepID=A0A1M5U8B0_9BRAD|nr:ABC-three component system protein [Bradyrhizobium erythrophlei]SHH59096.1 hypothetical protein SAMN05443248_5323 [Bradyrhizobium erythrophlei]
MRKDYRLYELNNDEFEALVVRISVEWFGAGVTPFATGRDGGRDGKFHGTASKFPSAAAPLVGHCVLQAKHVNEPNKSCSERDFERLLKKEHAKVKRLIKLGICDHYIVFTNRKLTAGADQKLIAALVALGLKSGHIIGNERLHLALDEYRDIRRDLPNANDSAPFRFEPDDLVEVIGALHTFVGSGGSSGFNSARDFTAIKIKAEKNKINGIGHEYYEQIIVNDSMPHFSRIEEFLKNPRNEEFAALYHDAADELKQKILVNRDKFGAFDEIFAFLNQEIQKQRAALRGRRRLVNVLLHYMYFNCDIGSKKSVSLKFGVDANA